jgi:phosphoglycerate kinase
VNISSIKKVRSLRGQRVLIRVDFNVPISKDFKVDEHNDYRLIKTLPTIKYLIKKGAKVVIMAHLGRPKGKIVESLRLDPVALRLSQLLKSCVYKSDGIVDKNTELAIAEMKNGEVMLLENIRFDSREEKGDVDFACELARLGDLYVNEAFAVSHRNHASVATISRYLPTYAGLLLEEEIKNLSRATSNPKKPLTVIVGGAKISTKIKVIKRFLEIADDVMLGGALANTVLKVMGVSVGKSLVEPKMYSVIKKIKLTNNHLHVPVDGLLAKSFSAKTGRMDALADVKKDEVILDVGPDTIDLYSKIVKSSKTIVWNGPMGLIETPFFAQGTIALIKILSKSKAYTIVGGGESVQAIRALGLEKKFNFISTGGGAMLEFLEGKPLPGLKKIIHNQ